MLRINIKVGLVTLFFIIIAVPLALSITRTISDTHDDIDTFIVNSNGNIWEDNGSNIQAAINDLNPELPAGYAGYGGTHGYVWLPGNKTFIIDSTLTIERRVTLDMRGSTIVPSGDFDVIEMRKASQLRNGIINVSSVNDFDHATITFRATDGIGIKDQLTIVSDIELISDGLRGKGIYLLTEGSDTQYIVALFHDIKTREFEYGIFINHTGTGDAYINGNMFSNVFGYGDKYFITLYEEQQEVSGNYFQNVQCNCTSDTEYIIWNNGQGNVFDNVVAYNWDNNGGTRASYNFSTQGVGNEGGDALFISFRGGSEDLKVGNWVKWGNSYTILDLEKSNLTIWHLYEEG
ncbi:MAG: hypothetical protein KAT37_01100 [Candidatus Aenigmarchaeota archaeon]|nr:hypothetical protein [Candidatus Aenigmarchaeota archaeon]